MIMNKKGFTLVELLAVIAIIALISLIAIPNIVGLSDGIKKEQMLDDAQKMISAAKYQVNKDYTIRSLQNTDKCVINTSCTFSHTDLNTNGDFTKDPDGDDYIEGSVRYTNDGTARYCVYLLSKKRKIGNSINDCVMEENLYSKTNVQDR